MTVVSVYAVFGSAAEAEQIGRLMVEERMAACVNLLAPCESIYRWEGSIESAQEFPAIFKTTAGQADALIARIAELHSYELPCVAAWPIRHVLTAYADWVEAEAGPR